MEGSFILFLPPPPTFFSLSVKKMVYLSEAQLVLSAVYLGFNKLHSWYLPAGPDEVKWLFFTGREEGFSEESVSFSSREERFSDESGFSFTTTLKLLVLAA